MYALPRCACMVYRRLVYFTHKYFQSAKNPSFHLKSIFVAAVADSSGTGLVKAKRTIAVQCQPSRKG